MPGARPARVLQGNERSSAALDAPDAEVVAGVQGARARVDVGDEERGAGAPRRVAEGERVAAEAAPARAADELLVVGRRPGAAGEGGEVGVAEARLERHPHLRARREHDPVHVGRVLELVDERAQAAWPTAAPDRAVDAT